MKPKLSKKRKKKRTTTGGDKVISQRDLDFDRPAGLETGEF